MDSLRAGLACLLFGVSGVGGTVFQAAAQELRYEEIQVTERVIAFVPNELGAGNAVAILGANEIVVIDATFTAESAAALLDAIRRRTSTPVSVLVYTHWHDDHIWGAQAFIGRYPNLRVVAHPSTEDAINTQAIPGLRQNIDNLRARIAERRLTLESGVENGQPLSDERRGALEQRQRAFAQLLESMERVRPVLPTQLVDDSLVLDIGGLSVRILMAGRGHTAGDLVVHAPSEGVLITGDLVTRPFPAAAEAFVFDWIETLERLDGLVVTALVPGHGDVVYEPEYVRAFQRLLSRVRDEAQRAFDDGLDATDAVGRIDVDTLDQRFVGTDPSTRLAFHRFFLDPAVASVYRALRDRASHR